MLHKKFLIILYLCSIIPVTLTANEPKAVDFFLFKKNIQEHLLDNKPYVLSQVKTENETQEFIFTATGLHNNSCVEAMKIIGHYEGFADAMDFITSSTYKNGRINLNLSSSFLPFDMVLNFKIPRIQNVGTYPFIFDNGFLLGLNGLITIKEFSHKNYQCLIGLTAYWKGRATKIPDSIFEIFTQTLGNLGIQKLFRMSNHKF